MRSRVGTRTALLAIAVLLAIAALLAIVPAAAGNAGAAIRARKVAGGLRQPVAFTFGPGPRLWYGEKQSGEIRVRSLPRGRDRRFFVVPRVNGSGERGLLGIALHPDFPEKPYVYAYVTRRAGGRMRNQIVRLTSEAGRGRALRVVFSSPASSSPYHNGGRILFGPDGMLYAIVGDGHDARNAQRLGDDRGKILRLTPAGGIPADNPLGDRRSFAYGIRNSFGFGFDPKTGDLWETENGPECNDELNRIAPGRNYGWGPSETCSGRAPRNTNRDGPNPVLPERWYTPTIAPTGLAFCDGCALGAASRRALFFGAANTGQLRRVTLNAGRDGVRDQKVVFDHASAILSVEAGPGGSLYFSDFDAVFKLVRR